jgi:type I restriction enzyme S subunit
MDAVDEHAGAITRPRVRSFGEVKKGYTFVAEGDVLFAKITPCMQNGKHAIATGLIGGIGFASTEFHVLRPGPDVLAPWVHHFVRQPSVLQAAERSFTGSAGQQRAPEGFFSSLFLPYPSIPEQRRILGLLETQMAAVERARAAAEAQLEAASALPAAYLRQVFCSIEAQQWPAAPLGEIGEIVSGITLGRKLSGERTQRIAYLRVANVKDGYLNLADVYTVEATDAEIIKLQLRTGDLLLTEGGDPDKLGRGSAWRGEIVRCIH